MKQKEAINRIKERLSKQAWCVDEDDIEALSTMIPELKESEDERIRKWIVGLLHQLQYNDAERPKALKAVEWLEKQKEQKPAEYPEKGNEYWFGFNEGKGTVLDNPEQFGLYKPAEWSEEDEKMRQSIIKDIEFERNFTSATTGRVIGKYNEQIAWLKLLSSDLKKRNEDVTKLCSNEWSEEERRLLHNAENAVYQVASAGIGGYTKKDYEEISSFFRNLRTSRPQPKQEWSEGTKKTLDKISDYLKYKGYEEDADFIRHLCPQSHWKPSEEQMVALGCVRYMDNSCATELESLYNDLKKL